ncbi:GNAT family N-acetyltransferase [Kocuria flava]|uniref:GNAT family N-acetyltransferase n=1 Tax=Kocuria flava TaxID=446860 RepID=UPI001FF2FC90|nr:GNAT family N-acetyltransferase [Kocuria flava]MCJ8504287.1 GNAT family N-acetyltransferase [Kocuria flava]
MVPGAAPTEDEEGVVAIGTPMDRPETGALVLRPARLSDMFLLMDLADQVGYRIDPEWIRARLDADAAWEAHVVATVADVPVAAAHLYLLPPDHPRKPAWGRLTALVVDEDHRGAGCGSVLLEHCEQLALDRGATVLEIAVPPLRHPMDAFWRGHGFGVLPPAQHAKQLRPA